MRLRRRAILQAAMLSGWLISNQCQADMPMDSPARSQIDLAQITLSSSVQSCLTLSKKTLQEHAGVLSLVAQATSKTVVGQCGCTSRLLSYRVIEKLKMDDGQVEEYERTFGIVAAPRKAGEARTLTMVLRSDPEVIFRGPLNITLACKHPD